jgi:hypothetical protein
MRMKEDQGAEKPWSKPACNVHVGTEDQFVVGFSIHQRTGDTGCLIPHVEQVQARLVRLLKHHKSELLRKKLFRADFL